MSSKKIKTRNLTIAALFICLGVLFPFVTSHAFGVQGTLLLPMHLPVILCGFITGPYFGLLCGFITPILSSLLTGMPPAYPMLPIMITELSIYGLSSGLFYKVLKLPKALSLISAMVLGRFAYGIMFYTLTFLSGSSLKALSVGGAVITGLPGICSQLILIPFIITYLEKTADFKNYINKEERNLNKQIEKAQALIEKEEAKYVIIKNERIVKTGNEKGLSGLINLYENNPELLENAVVVDKIIGKAAAIILCLSNIKSLYALTISISAEKYLKEKNIDFSFSKIIDKVQNRTDTGLCPIEASVLDIDDDYLAYKTIKETINKLKTGN